MFSFVGTAALNESAKAFWCAVCRSASMLSCVGYAMVRDRAKALPWLCSMVLRVSSKSIFSWSPVIIKPSS